VGGAAAGRAVPAGRLLAARFLAIFELAVVTVKRAPKGSTANPCAYALIQLQTHAYHQQTLYPTATTTGPAVLITASASSGPDPLPQPPGLRHPLRRPPLRRCRPRRPHLRRCSPPEQVQRWISRVNEHSEVCTVLAIRARRDSTATYTSTVSAIQVHMVLKISAALAGTHNTVTKHVATKACTVLCSRTDTHADCHMSGSL
jgi:hypothetical protein